MRLPIATYGRFDCAIQTGAFFLAAAGVVTLGLVLANPGLVWAAIVPVFIGLFVASFYRDFERTIPTGEGVVVAPADGRVVDIVEIDEKEYLGARALRVGIFLSPLNVHVNRSPLAGTVERVVFKPGKMLKAYDPRCIDENESNLLGLKLDSGLKVGIRQVTGTLARRIVCAAKVGDRLERGQRYGMIKLGSRTELIIPTSAGFACAVKVGDMVAGGVTVMGRLPSPAPASAPIAQEARA